jgi:DNA ligase D-like protein (predicted 3'-phosphoesterase)
VSARTLDAYRRRRSFGRTPEPKGGESRARRRRGGPTFTVQKHAASRLHYDLRLEADGMLKCWALPKGPSTDPEEKRLAMPTEDHPIEYADFEGVIPEGENGAGTVLVWDRGRYRGLDGETPLADAIGRGRVRVWLDGEKLKGGVALTRMGGRGRERWLPVKMDDDHARRGGEVVEEAPGSVATGRDLDHVAAAGRREGTS